MLNKAVCKACHCFALNWIPGDERRWADGVVECPRGYTGFPTYFVYPIYSKPPGYCPRKFEHAVASGMETADAK